MELNPIIFPAPPKGYQLTHPRLIIIPRVPVEEILMSTLEGKPLAQLGIPCLFLPSHEPTDKLLVYFHANAEDVGLAEDFLRSIKDTLHVHVLAIEYPGYGEYEGKPNEAQINADAETLFDFLQNSLHINPSSIHLLGRSIGSGPAVHLASVRKPGSLTLVSAYLSIRKVSTHVVGALLQNIAHLFLKERFPNEDKIGSVECPILFIHGKQDELIPCSHARDLHSAAKASHSRLEIRENMQHNTFSLYNDVLNPMYAFWRDLGLSSAVVSPIDPEPLQRYNDIILYHLKHHKLRLTRSPLSF